MLPIRICMVLLILVTWNDWTTVLICWCFSESNGCCCGNKTTTKKHLKLTVCPNIRKEILTDQIKKSLPNNIWRGISTQKIHPIEISTENNFKRNIHQQKSSCSLDEKLQTSKLMKFNKNGLFHQISSVLILAMFPVLFSQIFWWRWFLFLFGRFFSSDVFFVEIFLQFSWEIFGRDFWSDIFLAGDVSSEFPWYNFSRLFLVEKLFDKFVAGGSFLFRYFFGEISL